MSFDQSVYHLFFVYEMSGLTNQQGKLIFENEEVADQKDEKLVKSKLKSNKKKIDYVCVQKCKKNKKSL